MPWLLCFGGREICKNDPFKSPVHDNALRNVIPIFTTRSVRRVNVRPAFNTKFSELSLKPERLGLYLRTIARSKFYGDKADEQSEEAMSPLGELLRELYELIESGRAFSSEAQETLDRIIEIRKGNVRRKDGYRPDLKEDFNTFIKIKQERDRRIFKQTTVSTLAWGEQSSKRPLVVPLQPLAVLTVRHRTFWGSRQQLRSGKLVGDVLGGLDPIFGALLNPTGGRIGRGDSDRLHRLLYKEEDAVAYHSAAHDAFGYLIHYHNLGPGYNYLGNKWTLFKRDSPLSGHTSGINYWRKALKTITEGNEF